MTDAILEQTLNGLMMGSIYVLVALGMVLIYGVMHVVNFAHGVLFTAGGYLAHFFYTRVLDSYPLAILLSMVSLAAIGIATERGVFRPLSGNLRNQVIASLGLILAIENLVVALWGPNALQFKVPTTEMLVSVGELRFSVHHLGIIVITLAMVALLGLFLKFTRFGTAIRASQSREAAMVVGIPVERALVDVCHRHHARRPRRSADRTAVPGISADGRRAAREGPRGHPAGRNGQRPRRSGGRHDHRRGRVGIDALPADRLPRFDRLPRDGGDPARAAAGSFWRAHARRGLSPCHAR
jgi:hypothetical protein